jgi:hypothetical protein
MNYEKETISDVNICGYITSFYIEKKFEYQRFLQMDVIITISECLTSDTPDKRLVFFDVQDLSIGGEINCTYYCRLIIQDVRERQLECCNYRVIEEESRCIRFYCKEYKC